MADNTVLATYSVTVRIQDHSDEFEKELELNVKSALKAMADATLQRAVMLAPMSNIEGHAGTLRATGLVAQENDGYTEKVQFGNGIPYARYQEFGPDGSGYTGTKNPWDYTTPGTGAHYLETAGDSVAKEGIKSYL